MPRPSYKQLYLEEKAARDRQRGQSQKVMDELRAKKKEYIERAELALSSGDIDAKELVYLERISELQAEVRRLVNKIDDMQIDIAAANAIINKK